MNMKALATDAVREAARMRADHRIGPMEALCPFDLADRLGIVTWLEGISSLEGVYASGSAKPAIVQSALRPPGRRRYTCAHEIGHHVFKHGLCLEELADEPEDGWKPEEFLANRFAAALLMPKLAVTSAFVRRAWSASAPTPEQVFTIAQEFGVGYTTLIGYLERTLRILPRAFADTLRRISLSRIRGSLAGFDVAHDLVVIDDHRGQHPIDIETGDLVLVPATADFEGRCAVMESRGSVRILHAVAQGPGQLDLHNGHAPLSVLVSRRGFVGLARVRHLEEVPDEE